MLIHLFAEAELSGYLAKLRDTLKQTVHDEEADYLLNVNEEDYAQHLLSQFKIEPIQIHFDEMHVTSCEKQIPAEQHPRSAFDMRQGGSYPRQVITYHIPYEGAEELLRLKPNPFIMRTHPVELKEGCICFDIINFYNDPEWIKRGAEEIIKTIKGQAENVRQNVDEYNNQLLGVAKNTINERRQQLGTQYRIATSLGVPIEKSSNVPATFSIPHVRRKVVPKPTVPVGADKPEPTLDQETYEEILNTINYIGKEFERLPSTYADKDEDTLRDHLIMILEPNFEGSTTGETFNKSGKTDILIRHEGKNVFVAECKFWSGEQNHIDTIDQLLGYLTWRDSKTAIICFVNRQDFTAILGKIVSCTKKHNCYVSYLGAKEESWHNFEFHLPGDPERKVKLAILAFHLPQ